MEILGRIMKNKVLMLTGLYLVFASLAMAASTECPQHYFGGQAPDSMNDKLATKTPVMERLSSKKTAGVHNTAERDRHRQESF
jgi:hypothetical protein